MKPSFSFLDPQTSYLRRLRIEEGLNAIWARGRDEWESQRAICHWLKRQFGHSNPYPHPPCNARVMLHWIRSGRSGIYCAMFVQILIQLLAALGVPARYVRLFKNGERASHASMEVWSRQFGKWVVLDPDFDLYYLENGVPLGATDLARAAYDRSRWPRIRTMGSPFSFPVPEDKLFSYFRHSAALLNFDRLALIQTEERMLVKGLKWLLFVPAKDLRAEAERVAQECAGLHPERQDEYCLTEDPAIFNASPPGDYVVDKVGQASCLSSDLTETGKMPVLRWAARSASFPKRSFGESVGGDRKTLGSGSARLGPVARVQITVRRWPVQETPRPEGQLAFDGRDFVALCGEEIRRYSTDGCLLRRVPIPRANWVGIAAASSEVWLLDSEKRAVAIMAFSSNGEERNPKVVWQSKRGRPIGLARTNNQIWVCGFTALGRSWIESLNGEIVHLDSSVSATRLAAGASDTLWLLDSAARTVWRVDPARGKVCPIELPKALVPLAVASAPNGGFMVTDALLGTAFCFHQDGRVEDVVSLGGKIRPWFCAAARDRLAVSDYSSGTIRFCPRFDCARQRRNRQKEGALL